jgi:Salmonella virulence plasmid 65kDa B protein/Bacterial TSP3 repeat
MNKFTKNSIAIFLNLSFAANQLFSQVQPPSAAQWVPYGTGPQGQPGWWAGRGATNMSPENDYAALKQGQLKHFARKAIEELNARYATTGGAGSELNQLLQGWKAAAPDPKDQELVAVGQLKWVANKLHTRLIALGAGNSKPEWLTVATGDNQIANLGQLKTAFNFTTVNPLNLDTDGDGLPDVWELANGSNPNVKDATTLVGSNTNLYKYTNSILPNIPGALAAIPPLTLNSEAPHQAVGAIKGSLAVGGDGSASYSVPIDIPKGTGGMEPKLSLGYSSNGGNGVVGVGWSLGGLQTITRGPATVAKDGFFDPVDFDLNDRFFLDGERLVCVNGIYGKAGSEYRTEMDSYGRITYNGAAWKVETKAGLIVMLGQSLNSRVVAPDLGTLSWGVNRVSDTLGNYYDVIYDRANRSANFDTINFRVEDINYTGNSNLNKAPYCNVHFTYQDRPDDTRTFTTHASHRSSCRLETIKVSTSGWINHSYVLAYKNSFQTGRSFLQKVTKYANGIKDAAHTVPATEFTYDGLELGDAIWGPLKDVGLPQLMKEEGKDRGIVFSDFNGDGLPDFSSWRATDFENHYPSPLRSGSFPFTPVTEGGIYTQEETGKFVKNNTICPPQKLPLGVNYSEENARKVNEAHHLVA